MHSKNWEKSCCDMSRLFWNFSVFQKNVFCDHKNTYQRPSRKNDIHFGWKHYLDYLFNYLMLLFSIKVIFICSSFAQKFCTRARLENEMIDSQRAMKVSKQFRPYFKGCCVEITLQRCCLKFFVLYKYLRVGVKVCYITFINIYYYWVFLIRVIIVDSDLFNLGSTLLLKQVNRFE